MLLTVKDACELHPMVLDYAMSEQIENLSDVRTRTADEARDFFTRNKITRGMELLLSQGLRRLAGREDQAAFELKQAMGGKTHSMLAFGFLARFPEIRKVRIRFQVLTLSGLLYGQKHHFRSEIGS